MLLSGIFLIGGGAYALLREVLWEDHFRAGWAIASVVVLLAGLIWTALATDKILLKDAYFSMTPERIAYRVALLGRERVLPWQQVMKVWITNYFVVFEMENSKPVILRLGSIQQEDVARHVAGSLRLAALEKNIPINGVVGQPQSVVV
ncbi:hypothetical protein I2I11_01920 [Pontibacter sp. 172403-2]|uniref:hypothetical protein n=1 Tax=Pontibacter rufus TaxID=2791028 RepID=UPI0018AFA437|nr:hypothetical protein [Pontibacter sp. 172403-2]MBF9252042.1 hypothetical protein [Pontibacter sp. 172403-2]